GEQGEKVRREERLHPWAQRAQLEATRSLRHSALAGLRRGHSKRRRRKERECVFRIGSRDSAVTPAVHFVGGIRSRGHAPPPRAAMHLGCLVWGILIEILPWTCPLTW